jgi:hypothetical protein
MWGETLGESKTIKREKFTYSNGKLEMVEDSILKKTELDFENNVPVIKWNSEGRGKVLLMSNPDDLYSVGKQVQEDGEKSLIISQSKNDKQIVRRFTAVEDEEVEKNLELDKWETRTPEEMADVFGRVFPGRPTIMVQKLVSEGGENGKVMDDEKIVVLKRFFSTSLDKDTFYYRGEAEGLSGADREGRAHGPRSVIVQETNGVPSITWIRGSDSEAGTIKMRRFTLVKK